jgi:hypothetical protein
MERRSFIKKGFVGSVLFGLEPAISFAQKNTSKTSDGSNSQNNVTYAFLDNEDVKFFEAICPVMLGRVASFDSWPPDNIVSEVIKGVDVAIGDLSLATQDDLKTLFKLLSFRPTRYMITGVWSNWEDTDYKTIDRAMDNWSVARFNIWRSAYDGLRKLVLASWYANPKSWRKIGYPGPPFDNI